LPLLQNEVDNVTVFSAEKNFPFGDVAPQSILCYVPNKENKEEEIKPKIIPISQEINKIENIKEPMPISQVLIYK